MKLPILVSDTSILVDLERGNLLEAAFALSFEYAVPDILYSRELAHMDSFNFISREVRVEELDSEGVERAQQFRHEAPGLSTPDCFALALSQLNGWPLLTGDGLLRGFAMSKGMECHGLFWILDCLHKENVVSPSTLHGGLHAISEHPRCRLPRRTVNEMLAQYAQLINDARRP